MSHHLQADPSDYDPLLGPVFKRAIGSAAARVLAVLVRGLSAGVPSDDIRLWLRSRSSSVPIPHDATAASHIRQGAHAAGPYPAGHQRGMADQIRALVDSSEWERLVSSAWRKASSSSDASGARIARSRLIAARKLLAGLLQPLPGERALLTRNVRTRVALAEIGLRVVDEERGWDSAIVSNASLAAIVGWDQQAAERATRELRERHLVKAQRGGAYLPSRYRLSATLLRDRAASAELEPSATAMVEGTSDEIALLVRSVRHPAWCYSAVLNHRHWLLLLAESSGTDPAAFGIRPVVARQLRTDLVNGFNLTRELLVTRLVQVLDGVADDERFGRVDLATEQAVTARRAQELALDRYRVQADKNASAAKDASKRKQTTYEVLDELLDRHPIPPSPFGGKLKSQSKRQTRFRTWVDGFHREIVAGHPSSELKRRVGAALEQKLLGRGYPREKRLDGLEEPVQFAASTARFIMEADASSSLEDWLLGKRTSDMTGSQSGPRSAEGGER